METLGGSPALRVGDIVKYQKKTTQGPFASPLYCYVESFVPGLSGPSVHLVCIGGSDVIVGLTVPVTCPYLEVCGFFNLPPGADRNNAISLARMAMAGR